MTRKKPQKIKRSRGRAKPGPIYEPEPTPEELAHEAMIMREVIAEQKDAAEKKAEKSLPGRF